MQKILLVGDDVDLLVTRAAVLAKTGCSVTCCTSKEFAVHLNQEPCALVVLCHTLGPDAGSEIGEEVRRRWPAARLLQVLKGDGDPSSAESRSDAAVLAGKPGKLLERATALLAQSPEGRTGPQSM